MRPPWHLRPASQADHHLLASLLDSANRKHQHLDWIRPSELLGSHPFLMAMDQGMPIGCLACPPDPAHVAWIRIFACASGYATHEVWQSIWKPTLLELKEHSQADSVAALVIQSWFAQPLIQAGFAETNAVVFYEWRLQPTPTAPAPAGKLRAMQAEDLPCVASLDQRAFAPLWRNSLPLLKEAFRQATYATVYEQESRIVAYQISTSSALGAHLARLGVEPERQGQQLGTLLVIDMLQRFKRQGFERVTVNTQLDNIPSQRLYQRLGFKRTRDQFPVYERAVHDQPPTEVGI